MRLISHILRLSFALLIALQIGRAPTASSSLTSSYICSPSGQAPSHQAIAQLENLFAAAGKTLPKETGSTQHCEKCLTSMAAILPGSEVKKNQRSYELEKTRTLPSLGFFYSAQGPPLGGRAPPIFA